MSNVSPGVYTKIIDLSTFVQAVPSTIGFIAALTEKGEDNVLKFIGGRSDFISEFGEPNITAYGKSYGQGSYCAYNFLGEAGSLYFMRALSDNAAFSNMSIDCLFGGTDTTANFQVSYLNSINSKDEIESNLLVDGTRYPICILYPIGRGQWYNKLSIRLTEVANPTLWDTFILDIYEKQSDGQDIIIESFEVSFNPLARDTSGDSLWIQDILTYYSSVLRAEMVVDLNTARYSAGYDISVRVYDKEVGTTSVTIDTATLTDNKQNFIDWQTISGTEYQYAIIAKDARGNEIWGWLGAAVGSYDEVVNVYDNRTIGVGVQKWSGNIFDFDPTSSVEYRIKKSYGNVSDAFMSGEPVPLRKGSDGDLIKPDGDLDTVEATQLLAQAYSGIIDDKVLDTENYYMSMVFDCGYPTDVKSSIVTLARTRRDCVCILDNGDNPNVNKALDNRKGAHTYNTYFAAMYESYSKVYDVFTGVNMWVSPVFHMAYILPRNDNVAELWFAAAGFNRGSIDTIKELRFNPKLGERDQLYLKQLNPIVKFNPGYVVWGQLTCQAKASALQDLNIVRLVLYIKRAFEDFCRFFIFEQNDAITWGQVATQLVEFLEVIRKKRGLYNYSVDVGATDYEQKTKKFHVNVNLTPTRVVEQVELNFFIE